MGMVIVVRQDLGGLGMFQTRDNNLLNIIMNMLHLQVLGRLGEAERIEAAIAGQRSIQPGWPGGVRQPEPLACRGPASMMPCDRQGGQRTHAKSQRRCRSRKSVQGTHKRVSDVIPVQEGRPGWTAAPLAPLPPLPPGLREDTGRALVIFAACLRMGATALPAFLICFVPCLVGDLNVATVRRPFEEPSAWALPANEDFIWVVCIADASTGDARPCCSMHSRGCYLSSDPADVVGGLRNPDSAHSACCFDGRVAEHPKAKQ